MENVGGRPPNWTDPAVLEAEGEKYFEECIKNEEPFTITGLALALGTTRQTLMDYQEKDGFSDTVKRLKLKCENYVEKMALIGRNQAGAIFALKNYGWRDEKHVDHTTKGKEINSLDSLSVEERDELRKVYEKAMKKKLTQKP